PAELLDLADRKDQVLESCRDGGGVGQAWRRCLVYRLDRWLGITLGGSAVGGIALGRADRCPGRGSVHSRCVQLDLRSFLWLTYRRTVAARLQALGLTMLAGRHFLFCRLAHRRGRNACDGLSHLGDSIR